MRLLIEGCKYSGKSTLVQKLSNIHRNATKVEYRAFTQQGKTNNFAIHSDVEQRLIALSNFVVSTHDDDIFLLRGHLSVFALAETLNQSLGFSFYEIDKMFWEADILLVLLTINQDAYEERFCVRSKEGRDVLGDYNSWKKISEKQELYKYYFNLSSLSKIVIDTSSINLTKSIDLIEEDYHNRIIL